MLRDCIRRSATPHSGRAWLAECPSSPASQYHSVRYGLAAEDAPLATPAQKHESVKDRIGTYSFRKELCNYGSWQSAVGGLVSEGSFASVFMVESRQRGVTLTVFRGVCLMRTRPLLISTPGGSNVQLHHAF